MDDLKPGSVKPVPQPGLLKTIGVLNVLFGGALLLYGLSCLNVTAPLLVGRIPLRFEPELTQAVFDGLRDEQVKFLRDQEKAAPTDAERKRLMKERLDVEAKHSRVKDEVDFAKINTELSLSRLGFYLWVDVLGGPVLNLLFVFSGFGLLLRKNWARLVAAATAALKLLRLVVLTGLLIFAVIPHVCAVFDSFMATDTGRQVITQAIQRQQAQQGAAPGGPQPSPDEIARALRGVSTVLAVFVACFGAVYPLIALILLTRPGARAASFEEETSPADAAEF
jgi:hypothetical protein